MAYNDLFLRACRREPTERTPIWMMRQAGRYMPEYRAIREKHGFLEMCKTPELAVEVTLQPVDLVGVDAAILFADILLPLEGMGLDLSFAKGEGPVIGNPVRSKADVEKLRVSDPIEHTGYVMDAIRILRGELKDKVPLIGFAGAPFTLASYMIEGGSTRAYINCKTLMWEDPQAWDALMTVTTDTVIAYLLAQIEAGAQAVQVFDSWVGYLSPSDYKQSVLPHTTRVIAEVSKTGVPVINFANNATAMLDLVTRAGGDVIGLDWRIDIGKAIDLVGDRFAVQGNLDPMTLFAPVEVIEAKAAEILEAVGARPGHIFNLGHGIHKDTDPDHARALVRAVRQHSTRIRSGEAR
ncbi:MAG: uroporphyrinogen decarboxylase [Coriobacteriia bacterium]|nr:uroporphyrinogen decarboxylase [Coriobacteriia bacterium]